MDSIEKKKNFLDTKGKGLMDFNKGFLVRGGGGTGHIVGFGFWVCTFFENNTKYHSM